MLYLYCIDIKNLQQSTITKSKILFKIDVLIIDVLRIECLMDCLCPVFFFFISIVFSLLFDKLVFNLLICSYMYTSMQIILPFSF